MADTPDITKEKALAVVAATLELHNVAKSLISSANPEIQRVGLAIASATSHALQDPAVGALIPR